MGKIHLHIDLAENQPLGYVDGPCQRPVVRDGSRDEVVRVAAVGDRRRRFHPMCDERPKQEDWLSKNIPDRLLIRAFQIQRAEPVAVLSTVPKEREVTTQRDSILPF